MEGLVLLALFAGLVFLAGPVVALVALLRTREVGELRASVARLGAELSDLRRQVHRLGSRPGAEASPAAAPPAAEPLSPSPAPVRPAEALPPADTRAAAAAEPVPAAAVAATPLVAQPDLAPAGASVSAPPTPPPAAPPPGPPAAPGIEWERWLGIRGAALLGGGALVLAALLFFQYSIQHGLITPLMRVGIGLATGIGALGVAEWLRPRAYSITAEVLSGAGVSVLYASLWAASVRYGLLGLTPAFGLMAVVTAACAWLSLRHGSLVVATMGLIGGFATPLLLASGEDRPIGLFGYILLLDLGFLAIGRKREWPGLALVSLAGTALLQGAWLITRMGPDRAWLGVGIVGLFALVFAGSAALGEGGRQRRWWSGQAAGAVFPFVYTLYFAARAELSPHVWPVTVLLVLLSAAALWLAMRRGIRQLALGAAAGSLAILAVWAGRTRLDSGLSWELSASAILLAVTYHLALVAAGGAEEEAEDPGFADAAAALAGFGLLAVLLLGAAGARGVAPWPWLAGWLTIASLIYWHAGFRRQAWVQPAAAAAVSAGFAITHLIHGREATFPGAGVTMATTLGLALLPRAVAWLRETPELMVAAEQAAMLAAAIGAVGLSLSPVYTHARPVPALATAYVLGALVVVAARRLRMGGLALVAVAATLLPQVAWTFGQPEPMGRLTALSAIALEAVAVAGFTLWPLFAGGRLAASRPVWWAAALSGPLWFWPLRHLWLAAFGDRAIGILPLSLAGLAAATLVGVRRLFPADDAVGRSAVVWLSAVGLCFVSLAIPMQLEHEWVTIGWALEGVALLALWRRLDHPGLKYLALLHFAGVGLRLLPTDALLGTYPRPEHRIVNWLLYTYLVPAAALLAGARLLGRDELDRLRPTERELYPLGRPLGAIACALGGILAVFTWINLAIADWFEIGTALTLRLGRLPARDLTMSIAWALYALVLLGLGMARRSGGLRWLSLAFLLVTIAKVFLYDLGELRDLYRVVSLLGLALSLILVSLLYQRFVFRRQPAPPG